RPPLQAARQECVRGVPGRVEGARGRDPPDRLPADEGRPPGAAGRTDAAEFGIRLPPPAQAVLVGPAAVLQLPVAARPGAVAAVDAVRPGHYRSPGRAVLRVLQRRRE